MHTGNCKCVACDEIRTQLATSTIDYRPCQACGRAIPSYSFIQTNPTICTTCRIKNNKRNKGN